MSQEKLKRVVAIILVTLLLFGVFGPTTSVAVEEISNEIEQTNEIVTENKVEEAVGETVEATVEGAVEQTTEGTKEDEALAKIEQSVAKFIPYTIGDENRAILEANVDISLENHQNEVEAEKIDVEVPKINEVLPEKVNIVKVQGENELTENNWRYDNQNGLITILFNTPEENQEAVTEVPEKKSAEEVLEKVLEESQVDLIPTEPVVEEDSLKTTIEQYKITYAFKLASIENLESTINLNARVMYKLKNIDQEVINQETKQEIVKDTIGSFVNVNTDIKNERISKGLFYSRSAETNYQKDIEINISDNSVVDIINVAEGNDVFVTSDSKYSNVEYINKKVQINREEFIKILGNEGIIYFKDAEGNGTTINNTVEGNAEGFIEVDLSKMVGPTTIYISKPVSTGLLKISMLKSIESDLSYSDSQIRNFVAINTVTAANIIYEENELPVEIKDDSVELEEPTTKATVVTNKQGLSTLMKNENVEIRVILETNSADDMLLRNPKIAILLPKEVQEVNMTNCNALYSDEIKLKSVEAVENENGKNIVINLEGNQTQYLSNIEGGINVVINLDITLDRLATSRQGEFVISYTNENEEGVKRISAPVKIVAPIDVTLVSEIEGYSEEGEKITSIGEDDKEIMVNTYTQAQTAKLSGQIINNYNNSISNLNILGRVASEKEEDKLGITLASPINVSVANAKVYYSAKADANVNLSDQTNGWTTGQIQASEIKSYLIVIDGEIDQGTAIKFEYEINIPENLSYNLSSKTAYRASFVNNADIKKDEVKNSGTITLTTGRGPNLELNLETSESVSSVAQGQYVTFVASIKNTGTEDATNVKLSIDETLGKVKKYSEGLDFIDDESIKDIGTVKAGEVKQVSYIFEVKEDAEIGKDHLFRIKSSADKINSVMEASKSLRISRGILQVKNIIVASSKDNDVAELIKDENNTCGLYIKNLSGETLNNLLLTYNVDGQIEIVEAGEVEVLYSPFESIDGILISNDKHTVTYRINILEPDDSILLKINFTPTQVGSGVKFAAKVNTELNGLKYEMEANTQTANIREPKAEVESIDIQSENSELKVGQEAVYTFKVRNIGELTIGLGNVICNLPEGLTFKNAVITSRIGDTELYSETIEENEGKDFIYEKTFLEVGEEITVVVTGTVEPFTEEEIAAGKFEKLLRMNLKYSAMGVEEQTDFESYYAVYEETEEGTTHKILGRVWNDVNQNAAREDDELGIANIQVMLIDADTMNTVKNSEGQNIIVTTAEDGSYQFTNLSAGKYMVAFLGDMNTYGVSQYRKEGVSSTRNSDAVEKSAGYEDSNIKLALTDVIEISTTSERNVDVGLYEKDKFNLSLSKTVTKITVNENGKVQEYDYSNNKDGVTTLAINGNDQEKFLVVEYKLTITNEGNVEGNVNKVVNYLPEDMKFNSSLNPDWYLGDDGNCYSTALANIKIKPGESKELTLLLTKRVTDEEIIIDETEILEEYNEKGVESFAILNGDSRINSASIEVIRKAPDYTLFLILVVVFAITLTGGSMIYMEKESIGNNKFIRRIITKAKSIMRNKN